MHQEHGMRAPAPCKILAQGPCDPHSGCKDLSVVAKLLAYDQPVCGCFHGKKAHLRAPRVHFPEQTTNETHTEISTGVGNSQYAPGYREPKQDLIMPRAHCAA